MSERIQGGNVETDHTNPHSGSNFDDFLDEEGILEEASTSAVERLLPLQFPLQDSVLKYDDPTEPVADDDWAVLQ
jgi:hypothetical protein